jgi:hypothetical protein
MHIIAPTHRGDTFKNLKMKKKISSILFLDEEDLV